MTLHRIARVDCPIRCTILSFALLAALTGLSASPDPNNVVWESPSADHHGSMPLGNGDIALNAWMSGDGSVQFYISKTDAWDDNARLVKIGKLRFTFEPNLLADQAPFHQELKLREGGLEISLGKERETTLRLWVDANHPVVHLTADAPQPFQVTAAVELWRTNQFELAELQVSDVLTNRKLPGGKQPVLLIEPDLLLAGERDRVGWLHHNRKSVGPELLAELQGLTGFNQTDPLLHRAFGAVVTAENGERLDQSRLHSAMSTNHRFSVFVLTSHPATPEQWKERIEQTIRRVETKSFAQRRKEHLNWWNEFWNRSWIHASARSNAAPVTGSIVPSNHHPARIGMDQAGGNQFAGELGRVSVFDHALLAADIQALADSGRHPLTAAPGLLFSGSASGDISGSSDWRFRSGLTIEGWIKPVTLPEGGARILDKISVGGSDGFLLDTHPGNSLRFICGQTILQEAGALPADRWTHVAAVADSVSEGCKLYVGGKLVADSVGRALTDEAAYISQMYALQRFITACAGRGAYPIKFNGSLFTVPPGPTEKDPDYRRWGPGYWWQNTRLPYLSLCTSGDFDLQSPLFRMYVDELLPLCKHRTKLYLGHEGAYYPECIMFWGAVFGETYGWTPFQERQDKLQESGWHKWEWVGGLELCWMLLDYFDHTMDRAFLQSTALPFCREILTFFDQQYPTNATGHLVMHPSQALETWWHCTNATPELAGCIAVTERLLTLPAELAPAADQRFWRVFRAKLPPIPLREVQGKKGIAPAEYFADKRNIENPELYPVFPFRLFAFNRPEANWALTAFEQRWDRGHFGWRQDDIFMAYLGLTEEARRAVVSRARNRDPGERFPAFWGPNYDWTPDQDHGGVLMKAFQSMLLQTDGDQIFLLPAWAKDWDVEFRLHAPHQTVLEGVYRDGKLVKLTVTPEVRRKDVAIVAP